jgi:hypothetical protein
MDTYRDRDKDRGEIQRTSACRDSDRTASRTASSNILRNINKHKVANSARIFSNMDDGFDESVSPWWWKGLKTGGRECPTDSLRVRSDCELNPNCLNKTKIEPRTIRIQYTAIGRDGERGETPWKTHPCSSCRE